MATNTRKSRHCPNLSSQSILNPNLRRTRHAHNTQHHRAGRSNQRHLGRHQIHLPPPLRRKQPPSQTPRNPANQIPRRNRNHHRPLERIARAHSPHPPNQRPQSQSNLRRPRPPSTIQRPLHARAGRNPPLVFRNPPRIPHAGHSPRRRSRRQRRDLRQPPLQPTLRRSRTL